MARLRASSEIRGCRASWAAMHNAPDGVPCHRVVRRDGELCDAFWPMGKETHRLRLAMEGVEFLSDGRVDMERFQWLETEESQ